MGKKYLKNYKILPKFFFLEKKKKSHGGFQNRIYKKCVFQSLRFFLLHRKSHIEGAGGGI